MENLKNHNLVDVEYKEIDCVEEDKLDAIANYQSASYFYKLGINIWKHENYISRR